MKNVLADGRLCRVAAKIFIFLISRNFRVLRNFYNAVSQQPYVGVEEGEWRGGPACTALAHAPSPLTQIVPNSTSRYTVFHSVTFYSVV